MHNCEFCGSTLADRKCYFCEKYCCINCMTDDRTRCKQCYIHKRKLGVRKILKRNKIVLALMGFLWFYAVYPGPFFPGIDPGYYFTTLIAAILIIIPLSLALFFWSLNPPVSDLKKEKD